jgi:hypothetical protein
MSSHSGSSIFASQQPAFEGQHAYEPNASERLLSPRLVILNLLGLEHVEMNPRNILSGQTPIN